MKSGLNIFKNIHKKNGKLKLKDGDGNFVGTGLTPDELKTFLGL